LSKKLSGAIMPRRDQRAKLGLRTLDERSSPQVPLSLPVKSVGFRRRVLGR